MLWLRAEIHWQMQDEEHSREKTYFPAATKKLWMHYNCLWKTPGQFCSSPRHQDQQQKALGHSEHSKRYADTLNGAVGPPTTSKRSTSTSTEERGARWIPLGELPRDDQWEIMSLQHVLPKPKCMPYTSLLGAAAGCQHPCGICRPPLHSLLPQCCYHNSSAGVSSPMLTAPVTARSARQQVLV